MFGNRKRWAQMGSQTFKKETVPIHYDLFQKEAGRMLSEWFCETSVVLKAKPKKIRGKETTDQSSS